MQKLLVQQRPYLLSLPLLSNTVYKIASFQNYLAFSDGNNLEVYKYSSANIVSVASQSLNGINAMEWLAANDGNYYLATGSNNIGANLTLNVYKLTFPSGGTTGTLTTIVSISGSSIGQVNAVSWLPVNKQFNYLAIGGVSSPYIRVYVFKGTSSLSQVFSSVVTGAQVNGIDWFGPYLAIAQTVSGGSSARILNCDAACLNCLIDSNSVTNVRGGKSGIGYAISEPNLFINNVGYNNDSNYYPQQQNQDNVNQGF